MVDASGLYFIRLFSFEHSDAVLNVHQLDGLAESGEYQSPAGELH